MNQEILPQGDRIRQLLTKSNVTNANINNLLREKGVFLGQNEKNNSVPILMKTIVSPEEFIELYQTQKSKEDTIKFRTATIKCNKEIDLSEIFSENMNLNQKIIDAHKYQPTFKLIGSPNPYFENDKVIFEYKLEKDNVLEDWTNNKTYHTGEIIITKSSDGNLELSIEQNSTSKETLFTNDLFIREVKKILSSQNLISNNEDFIRIKFNDFINESRIQFLYSFTKNFCIYLDFLSITDIDLILDENEESHQDIKIFLDEIDSLKLNGKGLQNHLLLKNNKYHHKLIFASISLKYSFNIDGVKGFCTIVISFPDYSSKKDINSELQISINFNVNREHKKDATETQLRKKLYPFIEKNKMKSYKEYKTE
ncbi:hypothetical protein FPG87_09960 [Flavobacterium psychrophilum]|uniref:GapS4b family protein n=1 Tax=Flavobacterium psychrophilum TaxID=96345 RepID=UPI0006187CBC|nr:hypothetical protein [Flavobacterium psychrophilum]ELY1978869.1 hypothetical protein [Flavobacterium psychrophilum]OAE91730.1 hypothetical protein SU65_08085 [Flavobacterium psychrophilum]OJH13850.1 hypothetical protein FPG87_09960 [Flavobacterium psychrophilum]